MEYLKTFWSRRFLLAELVKKGIKLKYRRSYLGIIWSLLEPILTTIVLTIVFGTLFDNKDHSFPMYILSGRLLYSYFSSSTKACSKSIRAHAGLIKKVYVPKYLYPMSSVLYNYVIFLISLLVMIPLGIYCNTTPKLSWLLVVIPLLILILLTFGFGMVLATITVFFRDVEYLWDVMLMIIMYTCAIFYKPERLLKSGFGWLLKYNPLYCIIHNFRACVLGTDMNWYYMLYAFIFSIVMIIFGTFIFYKKQDEFILHI
jgi:ABC-2 type transport system permease protein